MPHDPRKSLEDIRHAASLIGKFVIGRTLADYVADELFHAAIERELTIIGEAMTRLQKDDPAMAEQIPDRRQIIAFRNVLVHGYDIIDDNVVWDVVQNHLPLLVQRVEQLLAASS